MDYIIGVDGGGTKTEAVAYDLEDNKIGSGSAGPANLALNFDGATKNIEHALSCCMHNVEIQGNGRKCQGIYLGIAGIEVGDNVKRLESQIESAFPCKAVALHDAQLAHIAILQGKDGIITIAGTGSVSFGRYKEKTDRTGGWGHILGDEGSGYWIALEAMRVMTVERDAGLEESLLSKAILKHLDVADVDGVKEFVHFAGKVEMAAVAPVVAALAADGEPLSMEILDRAGSELALMTRRLYTKLGIAEPVIVGISGGILCNVDRVQEKFRACLQKDLVGVEILTEIISPTRGACYLHRQRKNVKSH